MDVLTLGEGLHEHVIARKVGKHAQLDLRIVGADQQVFLFDRDEGATDALALLRAHRDVLQIWRCARETTCCRHCLVERGVHAVVRVDELQQTVHVGAFELGQLAVIQHAPNDRMVVAQRFQHLGAGGVASLRLFHDWQLQHLEKDVAQLLWRVRVHWLPGHDLDVLFDGLDAVVEFHLQLFQIRHVHTHANDLHLRQDPRQRQLHIAVELQQPVFGELRPQRRI